MVVNNENIKTNFVQFLSKEQRKKYRWQYIRLMISALLTSFVFIIAIIEAIGMAFDYKQVFFIAITFSIMAIDYYIGLILSWKDGIELIQERIEKRAKKNLKQQKKQED